MKCEVSYIRGIHLNQLYCDLGCVFELLLFECSLPDHKAALVPYNAIENVGALILKKDDIKTIFHDADTRLIKFVLSRPMEVSNITCQTLAFEILPKSKSLSISKVGTSEICIFLDFVNKHFHGVESKQMDKDDILLSPDMLEYREMSHSMHKFHQFTSWYDKKFKALLRAYIYFLNHKQLNEKKFKQFLRSQENIPNFLKNVLEFENYDAFFYVLHEVFWTHICYCKKATHKKCSACRLVGYCSKECQTRRWAKHKEFCRSEVDRIEVFEELKGTTLQHLVKQFSSASVPVSFEVFRQELMSVVFVTCCPILENCNLFDKMVNGYFEGYPKSMWITEIKSLKKNFYAQIDGNLTFKKIAKQIMDAWQLENSYKINVPFGSYHDMDVKHNQRFFSAASFL